MLAVGGKRVAICRQGGGRDAGLKVGELIVANDIAHTFNYVSLRKRTTFCAWRNLCVVENNFILDGNNLYKTEEP